MGKDVAKDVVNSLRVARSVVRLRALVVVMSLPAWNPPVDLVGLPVAARIGRSKVQVPASSSIPLGTS